MKLGPRPHSYVGLSARFQERDRRAPRGRSAGLYCFFKPPARSGRRPVALALWQGCAKMKTSKTRDSLRNLLRKLLFAQGLRPRDPIPPSDRRPLRAIGMRAGARQSKTKRPQMPTFAICRTEKIKAWSTLTKSVGHNLRTSADRREHLNASAPEPLRVLCGAPDWVASWRAVVNGMHLRQLAQGQTHTLAREFFLGASPEWADGKSEADIAAWAEANVEWLRARFGAERVKLCVYHGDEQSPHLAAYVVGLAPDTDRAGRVRKDRGNGWTLSDRVLGLGGGKDALVKLQDEYAVAMERFELERGRRNSKAKHQTVAEWRRLMAEPMAAITVPQPPEATLADRIDIDAYGKRTARAAAQEVFRQFKPLQMQAKEVPKLRRQVAALLSELAKLQPLIDAYRQQRDFFAKALARLLGFEPDITTQHGVSKTVEAVKDAQRALRGDEPDYPQTAADGGRPVRARRPRQARTPRTPRPGAGSRP